MTTTLIVFGTLGLGMASPYVLIGVFPELLRFLPKPGAWMETFKQITGFILLGTVVFILSFMEPTAVVPTIALLLGVGAACWLVARTPLTAKAQRPPANLGPRRRGRAALGSDSFGWLFSDDERVAWQPFSLERLQQVAVEEGQTVLVDFLAEWCITCKASAEKTVLQTEPVKRRSPTPVPSRCTRTTPTIRRRSNEQSAALKSNGVPVSRSSPPASPTSRSCSATATRTGSDRRPQASDARPAEQNGTGRGLD